MDITLQRNMPKIKMRINAGAKLATIAVTEAVIEYGNIFVRVDQGQLRDSALISSDPENGKAVWDTIYGKRMYYTGTPSHDKNPQASLMWAEKGVKTYKKEIDRIAQNAFEKGMNAR